MTEQSYPPPGNPYLPAAQRAVDPAALSALEYQQLDRAGRRPAWAWGLLAALASVVGFVVAQLVVTLVFLLGLVVAGSDYEEVMATLTDVDDVRPLTLAFLLSAISASIPAVMLAHRVITGLSPRWLVSVTGRVRWRWLLATMGIALLTLVVNVVLGSLLPTSGTASTELAVNDFTTTSLQFLLVIVVLVPLQAAAEEYVFRGLMMQGLGSMTSALWVSRVVSVVVPALIFALFHGLGQSLPIFVDRFAFGVVAGVLAIVTGGIEAGIGYHVVNNWLAFGLGLFLGDLGETLDPQGGNWWSIVVTVTSSTVFLALSVLVARKMGLQTRSVPGVLEASRGRV